VVKRKLRDLLSALENTAPDAHKVRMDENTWRTFSTGEREPKKPLKRYGQVAELFGNSTAAFRVIGE
jgi:hypothetical protein